MPTGYTACIADGITFREFALRCSRAFGATIMQRDDPADEPPRVPERCTFYEDAHRQNEQRLTELESLTQEQIVSMCDAEYQADAERADRWQTEKDALRLKYYAMLEQVRAWDPPSPDHEEMKAFMTRQIEESIRFDCHDVDQPERKGPGAWHAEQLACARRALERSAKEVKEERERHERRKLWIEQLYASLEADS